jgi:hypothetical protein
MGRQGYKGISSITNSVYVINDDGDHVIKMMEIIGPKQCIIKVIAGQPGIEGSLDSEIGTNALLSRPGRVQADMCRRICYFGDRRNNGIRMVHLNGQFAVSTLNVDFGSLAPDSDLDFNR